MAGWAKDLGPRREEWDELGEEIAEAVMAIEDDAGPLPSDEAVVSRLRAGDEAMFALVLDTWSPGLRRLARGYVTTDASADEVVQDTWVAVIRGLDGFEGRSALRTWVYRILVNTAKTRAVREARTVPSEELFAGDTGPTVDPARFRGSGSPGRRSWNPFQRQGDPAAGTWLNPPAAWPSPESSAVARETRTEIARALAELPERQRIVVALRDADGWSSEEVCEIMGISAGNQRVLLHRGRAALRTRLEEYFSTSATEQEGAVS